MSAFPRGNPGKSSDEAPLATASWGIFRGDFEPGCIWLGRDHEYRPAGHADDRHLITVAGSRAGKGRSCIIPNLSLWFGSCIVLDPKGENAFHTAVSRARLFKDHKVVVLDPFNIQKLAGLPSSLRGHFNPLDLIDPTRSDAIDEAAQIADAMLIQASEKDAHWDESARSFLEALILHVVTEEPPERRHLGRVRELLMHGDRETVELATQLAEEEGDPIEKQDVKPFELLLHMMVDNEACYGVISGAASSLLALGTNERGGILSTARRNTKFLDSPDLAESLHYSSFWIDDLKNSPGGVTIYLCIPAGRLATHSRWLRMIVNIVLRRMEFLGDDMPKSGHPVLFILDEFAALGHLESIEKAAGLIAGFGVKLWPILQDLTQIKRHYKDSWETFLGNAGLLQFFGNTDITTLEYISKRLGEMEILRTTASSSESSSTSVSDMPELSAISARQGGDGLSSLLRAFASTTGHSRSTSSSRNSNQSLMRTPLMTPEEVGRYFSRESGQQLVFISGSRPVALLRTNYDQDADLAPRVFSLKNQPPPLPTR